MNKLAQLQRAVLLAVAYDDQQIAHDYIETSNALSAEQRLSIYQGSRRESLIAALKTVYPVCHKLVGEEFFIAMATLYVKKTPSSSPDLADYGATFSLFIADFEPAQSLLYLSDVAKLEWAWHLAYIAKDHLPLDFAQLSQIPEVKQDSIIFELPPCASLLNSSYPIHRIWEINQDYYQGEETIDLAEGDAKLIIWRKDLTVRVDILSDVEWQILSAFAKRTTLGELCEQLVHDRDYAVDITAILPTLIEKGWLSSFGVQLD